VGSREGIRAVDELRRLDTSIVVETCPHYLVLTDESWDAAKVAPPIRKAADQAAVIEALVRGDLNTLGSDEIPYTLDEKNMSTFWSENTAFSGCGLMLPVAITSGLPLPVVAEATSAAPARAFGLDQKGSLDVGKDADLVIVDIDKEVEVRPEDLTSSSDFSVYDGLALRGWPITTISRGEVIFDKGDFPAPHGRGKYLFRSLKTG
jgi:dihydropyrimidinase